MKSQIRKVDMLIIRACKSIDPEKRLRSIYRRFYLPTNNEEEVVKYLSHIVMQVAESLGFTSRVSQIIDKISPNAFMWRFRERVPSFDARVLHTMINEIRFLENSKMPEGFIPPLRYRRPPDNFVGAKPYKEVSET